MSFWAYMLHCRGGAFYVGHTDDLERRVGAHKSGLIAGFTADHLPAQLVWSQDFATRDEAKAAEQQIKGWSRAKKLALIRGDWGRISMLAKAKNGPSTSSGKSDFWENISADTKSCLSPKPAHPELVEGLHFSLIPHPDTPSTAIKCVTARIRQHEQTLVFSYEVTPVTQLKIPSTTTPKRSDNLWQTTCFELFVMDCDGPGYVEFNFSPSRQWAAYRFDSYRAGMRPGTVKDEPNIGTVNMGHFLVLTAALDASVLDRAGAIALSAVIEELDGTKSYWALAHPPGKPDFHAPTCFAITLAPPERP